MRIVARGTRTAVLSVLLTLLLLHVPAIAASPPPAFCDVDGHIRPGAGIGQLTLNQPAEDARRLLDAGGVPPKIDGPWVGYMSGPNSGVEYFARGEFIQVIAIFIPLGSLTRPPVQRNCHTPDGLGLLSREREVLALYGPAPRVYYPARVPYAELHPRWLIYDNQGVAFLIVTLQSDSILQSESFVAVVNVFAPGTFCTIFPKACSS